MQDLILILRYSINRKGMLIYYNSILLQFFIHELEYNNDTIIKLTENILIYFGIK